jgi:hypothetical protein
MDDPLALPQTDKANVSTPISWGEEAKGEWEPPDSARFYPEASKRYELLELAPADPALPFALTSHRVG